MSTNDGATRHAGSTDTGRWRDANQDVFRIDTGLGLYLVADGMGGHARGEVASRLAADTLVSELAAAVAGEAAALPDGEAGERQDIDGDAAARTLRAAIRRVNARVLADNRPADLGRGIGMGTTLCGIWMRPSTRAHVFNVGDSRVYRHRDGRIERLTEDHTLFHAWELGGRRGPSPPRNIILRAIGLHDEIEVDVLPVEPRPGDRFLICSDGLHGMVQDDELAALLNRFTADEEEPEATCHRLILAANAAGGEDNITVVLVQPLA